MVQNCFLVALTNAFTEQHGPSLCATHKLTGTELHKLLSGVKSPCSNEKGALIGVAEHAGQV